MSDILLTYDGKIDFLIKTNPFGSSEEKPPEKPKDTEPVATPPSQEEIASGWLAFARANKAPEES